MGFKCQLVIGIFCMVQAMMQVFVSALAVAEFYGAIHFLRGTPTLLFIRILYFNNADHNNIINIGKVLDGVPNTALILFERTPFTTIRTLIISNVNMIIGFLWLVFVGMLLRGSYNRSYSRCVRWPFVATTIAVCTCDLVAATMFANDTFHTATLQDITEYIGGRVSGLAGSKVDTAAAAWIMFIVNIKFGVLLILNIASATIIAIGSDLQKREPIEKGNIQNESTELKTPQAVPRVEYREESENNARRSSSGSPVAQLDSTSIVETSPQIPRAHYSPAFEAIKRTFFTTTTDPQTQQTSAEIAQLPWSYTAGQLPTYKKRSHQFIKI